MHQRQQQSLVSGGVRRILLALGITFAALGGIELVQADGWNGASRALNQYSDTLSSDGLRIGGIANTRHNLTMSYTSNTGLTLMGQVRNNYYEICVYCHTPHGANSTAAAPLWNRTVTARTYTLYDDGRENPTMLGQPTTQPGPNSLTCLSCHDGLTAIDSIINMPTRLGGAQRAGYSVKQETSDNNTNFLNAWATESNELLAEEGVFTSVDQLGPQAGSHLPLGGNPGGCVVCHNAPTPTNNAPDFTAFLIGGGTINIGSSSPTGGALLNDDHPIGVRYPEEFGAGVDYNPPTASKGKIAWFDNNGNQHADPNEVRLYNTGDGYEVECASCHDPHGVPVNYDKNGAPAEGADMIPSFLRVGSYIGATTDLGNVGSELCLTCHVK